MLRCLSFVENFYTFDKSHKNTNFTNIPFSAHFLRTLSNDDFSRAQKNPCLDDRDKNSPLDKDRDTMPGLEE